MIGKSSGESSKHWGQILKTSNRIRALNVIQGDILDDNKYMVSLEKIDGLSPDKDASDPTVGFPQLSTNDEDAIQKGESPSLGSRCYNSRGARTKPDSFPTEPNGSDCYFRVQFYKIQVKDRSFVNDDGTVIETTLKNLPISRINAKIQYKENGEDKEIKEMYLSRLATQIIYF